MSQNALVAGLDSRPRLQSYIRLKYDPVRQQTAVLAPERVFWPDEVTLDILNLCDGERTIAEIARELSRSYDAPVETIQADILEFVQSWIDRRILKL